MLCWCEDLDMGHRHQQTRIFGDGDLTHVWSLVCVFTHDHQAMKNNPVSENIYKIEFIFSIQPKIRNV